MASYFTRRIIAVIADFFVVSAFMWIISYLLFFFVNPYEIYTVYMYFPYVVPFLIMIYFVVCEKLKNATVGKALMYLQVRSRNGARITWAQTIVRNLSKIYWIPLLFDWGLGKILNLDDRLLGSITKTVVVNEFN